MTATALLLSMMLLNPEPAPAADVPPVSPSETTTSAPASDLMAGLEAEDAERIAKLSRADRKDWDDFSDFPTRPVKPQKAAAPSTESAEPQPGAVRSSLQKEIIPTSPANSTPPNATTTTPMDPIKPTEIPPAPVKPLSPPPVEFIESSMPEITTPTTPTTPATPVVETQELPKLAPAIVANRSNNKNHSKAAPTPLSDVMHVPVDTSVTIELDKPVDAAGITDPEVADLIVATPTKLLLVGKNAGATQLRLRTGTDVSVHHVHVEPNTVVLQDLIRSVAPSAHIRVGSVKGQIVLSGRVSDVQDVTRIEQIAKAYQGGEIINHINVAGVQQALLRVVVAEVNKDASRQLGVNWGFGGSDLSRDVFFSNNLNQLAPTVFGSNGLTNVLDGQLTYSLAPNAITPATNFSIGFPKAELQFFLNALRENSLGRTLAEPNLMAISGQTASFLVGGEVPIPVTQGGATAGAITIEYKEFGIRLAFTPTVLGGQIMRLHIMSEVSDAVPTAQQINGLATFSFQTRRFESTVECGNGQTFAMAGLLDDSIRAVSSKIPGIGDLPVLGTLFSSVDYQRSKTELVVLITPELVAPLDPGMVDSFPGADITEPDDFELYMLQKLEGGPAKPAPAPANAAPDSYVSRTPSPVVTASDLGIEGPWGMTGASAPTSNRPTSGIVGRREN